MFVKIAWILLAAIGAAALLEGLFQLVARVRSWRAGTVSKIRWAVTIALLLVALVVIASLEYNVRPPAGPRADANTNTVSSTNIHAKDSDNAEHGSVASVEPQPERPTATAEPQPDRPSFGGNWNDRSAFQIAWPEPRSPENPDGITDTFQKSFFVSIQGIDTRVLLTSRSEGGCQGCQIVLSVFSFEKKNSKWFLVNEARDFTKLGRQTFNDLPEITDVVLVGPSRFGITFTVNSWYQGESFDRIEAYAFVADELVRIMAAHVRHWFSGLVKADAIREGYWFEHTIDLKFDQSANSYGLFDILATYSSSESSKSRTVRVRFDGSKYAVTDLVMLGGCQATMAAFIEGLDDSSKTLRDCLRRQGEMTPN